MFFFNADLTCHNSGRISHNVIFCKNALKVPEFLPSLPEQFLKNILIDSFGFSNLKGSSFQWDWTILPLKVISTLNYSVILWLVSNIKIEAFFKVSKYNKIS